MTKLVFAGFVVLSLVLPTAALAQSADEGYGAVAGAQSGGAAGAESGAAAGSLPFTGLEIGVVLAAGLLLLATGLVLRRRAGSH